MKTNGGSSMEFYKELSVGNLGNRQKNIQLWLESRYSKRHQEEIFFFNEENFDKTFKDEMIEPDAKLSKFPTEKECPVKKNCIFSRDDISVKVEEVKSQFTHFECKISIVTDKGSEKVGETEARTESPHKNISNWKRPDLVEKRTIRALCDTAKDYFNFIADKQGAESNQERLLVWDELIKRCFPSLHKTSRLKILGEISVNCIGWKFSEKVNSFKCFTAPQRSQLLKHGKNFRSLRNSGKVKERKQLLSHAIIKIGKLLYQTSPEFEMAFWKHIDNHKQSEIEDTAMFQQVHRAQVAKVVPMDSHGDLFAQG
jgi:hypothetical protein